MCNNILYHASSKSGIEVFRLGEVGYGEHNDPSSAIWFGTAMEGAAYHIKIVLKNKFIKDEAGHIYECRLSDDVVLIDTKAPVLPLNIFKKLKAEFPIYKRVFMRRKFWYKCFYALSEKIGTGHIEDRLRVCKILGIEALANPRRGKDGEPFDDGVYGITIAVLDTSKIKLIDEYSYGVNDKRYQKSMRDEFAL